MVARNGPQVAHDNRSPVEPPSPSPRYVGTIIGESTSGDFRLAVAQETIREQDIIAVDAILRRPGEGADEQVRVWAKVQRIERLNPLFPAEAGHELAAAEADPFETVLSLSREMVTAVCQVLGAEQLGQGQGGRLDHLRYPPQPATRAYRPESADIARVVLGELQERQQRALDIGVLANRPEVAVQVDGHAIVTRHLAILAMTGAGKSWTARRVIEQLAQKHYPIVIFDPHGDYTGLADVPALRGKVRRYYAQFPLFEEESETVANIVDALGYELSDTMRTRFGDLFDAAKKFLSPAKAEQGRPGRPVPRSAQQPLTGVAEPGDESAPAGDEIQQRVAWLARLLNDDALLRYGVRPDMWLIAHLARAGQIALAESDLAAKQQLEEWGWADFTKYNNRDLGTVEGIRRRVRRAASVLQRMEYTNRRIARAAEPLPTDRTELVRYGGISVVSLAGYTGEFQATIYSLITEQIFEARVQNALKLPVLFVLEEAHNFVPGNAATTAEERAVLMTKQIAQEGRKFGVGLILISQRPSRLDETTLSQCNSFIVMRMVNPADQSFVRKVIETLGEDDAKLLPDLDVGEALLSGQLTNFPVLIKVKEPASKGEREEEDAFVALERAYRESRP